jgi:hypothetical protein
MVSVVATGEAPGVTLAGEKRHVAPAGRPEQVKETAELNPFCGVTVIVAVPLFPAFSPRETGDKERLKSAAGKLIVCKRSSIRPRSGSISPVSVHFLRRWYGFANIANRSYLDSRVSRSPAFGPVADSWKIAAWFHFPNGWIAETGPHGPRPIAPKDALDRHRDVLSALERPQGSYEA